MKLAIVGSRIFKDYGKLVEILYPLLAETTEIISGGASGADTLAENYAENFAIKCTIFKPDWDKHGKSAGFIRNQRIVDAADIVVAFWDGKSKGTKDTLDKARQANKTTVTVYI